MFPCSGDDLAVPYDPDPSSDDAGALVGGHFNVQPSSIAFEGGGHLDVPCPVLEAVDFGFLGMYSSCELVDVVVGFGKALVGSCCSSMYC